ncbi:MAG: hypothetical protein WC414_02130 [Patescibacteria group bacterium]
MNELVFFSNVSKPTKTIPAEIVAKIVEVDSEAIFFVDDFHAGFARVIYKKDETVGYSFISERTRQLAFNGMFCKFANHFDKNMETAEVVFFDGSEGTINVYGKIDITKRKKRRKII